MESHELLRQRNRKRRVEIGDEQQQQAATALAERLISLAAYQRAQRVAAYFAVNGEIGLKPLIEHALEQGKKVYLPNLEQQALRFSPYFHAQKMRINKFGLPEPDVPEREMLEPNALDLVLTPLVVFDSQCHRIGMGGGYYDRSFEFRKHSATDKPLLIGVAHELQRVEQIAPAAWDVPLDMVVTEQEIYR